MPYFTKCDITPELIGQWVEKVLEVKPLRKAKYRCCRFMHRYEPEFDRVLTSEAQANLPTAALRELARRRAAKIGLDLSDGKLVVDGWPEKS